MDDGVIYTSVAEIGDYEMEDFKNDAREGIMAELYDIRHIIGKGTYDEDECR